MISALAAAEIRRVFKTLNANGRYEIPDAQHFVGKRLINQRAVRERKKLAITVLFTKTYNIRFADKRLSAGIEEEIYPQFLTR
jgi:hypothetical protein